MILSEIVDYFGQHQDQRKIPNLTKEWNVLIGMRMMARPDAEELEGVFIEPVWVFRKSSSDYEFNKKSTLEAFLKLD